MMMLDPASEPTTGEPILPSPAAAKTTSVPKSEIAFFMNLASQKLYTNEALAHFRANPNHLTRMHRLLTEPKTETKISIRLIEYFISHYVHEHQVRYMVPMRETPLYVADDYQRHIHDNHKTFFDPCCRNQTIVVPLPDDSKFTTTVGQLLFFKWFIEMGVLDYLESHLDEIRDAFAVFNQSKQKPSVTPLDDALHLVTAASAGTRRRSVKRSASGDVQSQTKRR